MKRWKERKNQISNYGKWCGGGRVHKVVEALWKMKSKV